MYVDEIGKNISFSGNKKDTLKESIFLRVNSKYEIARDLFASSDSVLLEELEIKWENMKAVR